MLKLTARTLRLSSGAAALGLLPLAFTLPALADGPNNSLPNAGPPPPTFSEATDFPQLPNTTTSVVPGTCQQQYTNAIDKLWSDQVSETTAQLAFEGTAAALIYPASIAPALAAVAAGGVANSSDSTQRQLELGVASLPDCNATFIGSVEISNPDPDLNPGINVEGDSIFQSSVGIEDDLNVRNNITASTVTATQGGLGRWRLDLSGRHQSGDFFRRHYARWRRSFGRRRSR